MPIYQIRCEDCGHVEEEFHPFSAWDSLKSGETPFAKECPECGSKEYRRVYSHGLITETSPEQQQARLKKQINEDTQRIADGDIDFIKNIAGDKPINSNLGGQKYMKDVKRGAVKKRE